MKRFAKLVELSLAAIWMMSNAAWADEPPGTFHVPGIPSTFRVYGSMRVYTTYDISGRIGDIENFDWATMLAVQPLDGSSAGKEKGQLYFTARTSRLGLETSTPTSFAPFTTKIELDFNGPNAFAGQTFTNSVLFRLRHAYGAIGGLLVGQTWSLLTDLDTIPDTLDFNGPGAATLIRQPQIRYTYDFSPSFSLAGSIENARNGGQSHLPDFVLKLNARGSWGGASVALMTNQYRFDKDGLSEPRGGTRQGWGAAMGAYVPIGKGTFSANVIGGEGVGRYLFNAYNQFSATDAAGNFKLWRALAYQVGLALPWRSYLRSNVSWSQTFFDRNAIALVKASDVSEDDGKVWAQNKRLDQVFVNTYVSPVKNVDIGLEYEFGLRHTFQGLLGRENRITGFFSYGLF